MKNILFVLCFLLFNAALAQPDSLYLKKKVEKEKRPEWVKKQRFTVDLNEVSFVNWNAGGSNSISALVGYQFSYDYSDKYFFWNNNLVAGYGINGQQGRETRKTTDIFEINSNFGYNPTENSNWFYSARFNFKTQFDYGYQYPNVNNPISKFMAPGYLFFGFGMDYGKNIDNLSLYLSPITLKATFVLDETLANAGKFGVTPAVLDIDGNVIKSGKRSRHNNYKTEVAKNVTAESVLSLYSDYINNFGNVDVDWRLNLNFKVNNFIRATFESHIRYDDDVKTSVPSAIEGEFDEAGAKVQWKQFLGIGFAVDF
jgi:hypothetical protein